MVTRGHVINKKCYTSASARSMATKLNSFMVTWQIENVISPFLRDLCQPSLTRWYKVLCPFDHMATWGHVIKKNVILLLPRGLWPPSSTAWCLMKMDQHPLWLYDTVVISLFLHGSWLPNSKGDGFRYRVTTHKVPWFFDHLIICRVMVNKKRCISNSKSPMDTELDRVVTYDMGPPLKKSHQLSQKLFPFIVFFYLSNAPLIIHRATIRLLLLIRK